MAKVHGTRKVGGSSPGVAMISAAVGPLSKVLNPTPSPAQSHQLPVPLGKSVS